MREALSTRGHHVFLRELALVLDQVAHVVCSRREAFGAFSKRQRLDFFYPGRARERERREKKISIASTPSARVLTSPSNSDSTSTY